MDTITQLKNHPVLAEILADSFGGIMYNKANEDKYDATELIALWDQLDGGEKDSLGGLIGGALRFVKKEY